MSVCQNIIDYIKTNRVSTTEVADALGKTGELANITPITPDVHKVGRVRVICASDGSNYGIHDQVRHLERGEVALILAHGCEGKALLGDLIARFILMYKGAEALVVDGAVRDVSRLRRERYSIWAKGFTPIGCVNKQRDPFPVDMERDYRERYEGGVAVCDDAGVVIIPPAHLDEDMLDRLERIELQEDVWAYCLNTLKWDTLRIVCERAYLDDGGQSLPREFKQRLDSLQKQFPQRHLSG